MRTLNDSDFVPFFFEAVDLCAQLPAFGERAILLVVEPEDLRIQRAETPDGVRLRLRVRVQLRVDVAAGADGAAAGARRHTPSGWRQRGAVCRVVGCSKSRHTTLFLCQCCGLALLLSAIYKMGAYNKKVMRK